MKSNKHKLNICFFHLGFVYSGGGERLVLQEMEGLEKRGHKVVCYTPLLDEKNCFPDIIGKYDIRTVLSREVLSLIPRQSLKILASLLVIPFKFREFKDYDVFIGANQPGPVFCFLLTRILRKPYLVYLAQPTRVLYPRKVDREAGMVLKDKFLLLPFLVRVFNPLVQWLDKISIQKSDKMLVNGEYMLSILSQIYAKDGVNCPSGSSYTSDSRVNKWDGKFSVNQKNIKKPYVFLSNRHFPQKKFEWAIRAFTKVPKQYAEQLVISGGETWYTNNLKLIIRNLKLQNRVVFTGLASEKDVQKLYKHAAVYVYPAPEEDFGMGVVEAMAAGTPVVVWDTAGPSTTVVNGETGYKVKPYSVPKFSKAIQAMLTDKRVYNKLRRNAIVHARNYTVREHVICMERELLGILQK